MAVYVLGLASLQETSSGSSISRAVRAYETASAAKWGQQTARAFAWASPRSRVCTESPSYQRA